MLELARLLAGKTGDCAVDFIAFGGEEFGGKVGAGLGGYCYANDHAAGYPRSGWRDRIAWMGCVDGVGACRGRLKVGVGGSDALRERVQRVCDRAGVKVGGFLQGSDNNIFNAPPGVAALLSPTSSSARRTPAGPAGRCRSTPRRTAWSRSTRTG